SNSATSRWTGSPSTGPSTAPLLADPTHAGQRAATTDFATPGLAVRRVLSTLITVDDKTRIIDGVEPGGLEPPTPCLQSRCATNCAMAPGDAAWGRSGVRRAHSKVSVTSAQRSRSALSSVYLRHSRYPAPAARSRTRSFFMTFPLEWVRQWA